VKIFLDTANIEQIKKYQLLLDGITTNPTSLSKEMGDPIKIVREICTIMRGKDVSVEITEQEPQAVLKQAREIARLADNVVVKVPCYEPYYPIIHQLVHDGVRVNITLVFTVAQGLFMAKMGVTYISPFVGRWNDIGIDGSSILYQMRCMIDQYGFSTQILAASIRDVTQLEQAILAGADVATISPSILEKATSHALTDQGMAKFNEDWRKLNIKKFPS
jgi:transaldolase